MNDPVKYLLVESLVLPIDQRGKLFRCYDSLGPDSREDQPDRLLSTRMSLDGNKGIYKAAFDPVSITDEKVLEYHSVANGRDGNVKRSDLTQHGTRVIINFSSTDESSTTFFIDADAARLYLKNNRSLWDGDDD